MSSTWSTCNSCFPVVPKLAIRALRLPEGVPRTATGGLNAFGHRGNDYSLHALVAVTSALRQGGGVGLVYGNGEIVTKHHAVVLGNAPRTYVGRRDPVWGPDDSPLRSVAEDVDGEVTVVTHTTDFDREGRPSLGYVVGEDAAGTRVPALVRDAASLAALVVDDPEPIGRTGRLAPGADRRTELTIAA